MKQLSGRPADYWPWLRFMVWQARLRWQQRDLVRRRRVMGMSA